MAVPSEPYYVSFQTDRVPATVDHTRSSPGPSSSGVDRAGYTSVRQRARVTFAWDNGPARADGLVPFYAMSVNVFFWLDDFLVSVSSDYPEGSCAYDATRRHEFQSHIARPMRIFHGFRDILIVRLSAIQIPTQRSPSWVRLPGVETLKQSLEQQVIQTVGAVKQQLVQALRSDRTAQDSASSYRVVYDQCPAEEWARGRGR